MSVSTFRSSHALVICFLVLQLFTRLASVRAEIVTFQAKDVAIFSSTRARYDHCNHGSTDCWWLRQFWRRQRV